MNRTRGELLTRAVFAGNQDGHGCVGCAFDNRANIVQFRSRSQHALGGKTFFNLFAEILVLLDELLLAALKLRERLKIFKSDACLKSQCFDELFIFRLKFSNFLIQDLEDSDDFALRCEAERSDIACLEARV